MPKLMNIEPTKTYATRENAIKAVEKAYPGDQELVYIMGITEDKRYYPIFVGVKALRHQTFTKFCTVA